MKKLLYVERYFFEWVSIEKVFRQVADEIDPTKFETSFEKAPFNNTTLGIFKNLLTFRPRHADLYHVTGHIHYMGLVLPPDRTVLTIHDLRFLNNRTGLRRFVLKKLFLDWPLKRLKYITAISEATRQEIAKMGGIDPGRIRVIENPLRTEFVFRREKPFDSERPVILQIGTMRNKNIPNLVRAISGLSCRLVIIGKIDGELVELLGEHNVEFENKFDLSDGELVSEYEQSDIVTFCSTYEGFGLPIIEAQAMRKPVVTSDRSPMKEVAAAGAVLVDPDSVASIRSSIVQLTKDEALRKQIVEAGVANVKRFSAPAIAKAYVDLYQEVLRSN